MVLEAIAAAGQSSAGTHSAPHTFIGIDGKTYWAKGHVQQGLVAELIVGRLAARVGAGPPARVLRILPAVLAAAGAPPDLEGIVCGSEHIADTVNGRDLDPYIAAGNFNANVIDPASRARTIVFHSWLDMGDAQVLVRLTDGAVFTIDHGDCFGATGTLADPSAKVVDIPHVGSAVGRDLALIRTAVTAIERVTDREILLDVSGIPGGDPWRSPAERRYEIACWLSYRRDRLREIMETWAQT